MITYNINKFLIYLLSIMTLLNAGVEQSRDVYKNIDYFVLNNGLQVYLLTHKYATNTTISMTVNVGWDIENEKNFGLSHLVEHVVFRDKRVSHRDYLDYMKDEGAKYVNGFTSRYQTKFITIIDSNKSYWVAKTFAQMIFDKDVESKDVEIEKGALQVEIGEFTWYDKIVNFPLEKLVALFPPTPSVYETHFGLKKLKKLPSNYIEKINNKNFTMYEVMAHYEKYYYPSNMILKITGNFDKEKMRSLIRNTYGIIDKQGILRAHKPKRNAILSKKPYLHYIEGKDKNYGYIGTQYLFNDCQKHIILNAFMKYVSIKIQQKLRNKYGKSYSISTYNIQSRGAGIMAISFDGLHHNFNSNIKLVKKSLQHYINNMDDSMIEEALQEYKKRYTSISRLVDIVDQAEHMRSDHKIENKTHYDFFKTITPEKFRKVLSEVFIPENSYIEIYREYYFFPGDVILLTLLTIFMIIFIYFKYSHFIFSFRGLKYRKREVLLSHRISSRFIGFLSFSILIFITIYVYDWTQYIIMKYLIGDVNYLFTLDMPYGLYVDIISNILTIILMFVLFRWIMHYHSRIDVIEDKIYILGSKPITLYKKEIHNIEVVPWTFDKIFNTIGFSFLFWKPLLKIDTENKIYYIRSNYVEELQNDIIER